MTDAAAWHDLTTELDCWSAAGASIRLWLRDDDTIAPHPALDRLAALSERFDLPVLLAIIPLLAEPALASTLKAMPSLLPCQHGNRHRNHAGAGAKKSEFGPERNRAEVEAEIALGRRRLAGLLGSSPLPVFVPPWNRIDAAVAAILPALGFTGLSCFRGFALAAEPRLSVANTDIDIMDWQGGRIGRPAGAMAAEIAGLLRRRRAEPAPVATLGLLLHHRDHDEPGWAALETLLSALLRHPAIVPCDPRRLFSLAIPA